MQHPKLISKLGENIMKEDKANVVAVHAIIHSSATLASGVGAGLSQIPFSDNVPLMGIQTGMAIGLGKVYGIELSESSAKGLARAAIAGMLGPVIARGLSQLVFGWVPVYGNAVNASTAGVITEAIGWNLVKVFEDGGKQLAA
jgi:uncharacterized protein (DUF697 family)